MVVGSDLVKMELYCQGTWGPRILLQKVQYLQVLPMAGFQSWANDGSVWCTWLTRQYIVSSLLLLGLLTPGKKKSKLA